MKEIQMEINWSEVSGKQAKRSREVAPEWEWTEPSVWTERMLSALEQGVKGNKWYSLVDKVSKRANLESAFKKVKNNHGSAGVDHVSVEQFEKRLREETDKLAKHLKEGTYRPQAIHRVYIPKGDGRDRPLGIPTVRDRVVQTALRNVIEPIFENEFAEYSYGFRPGRSAKDALRRVDTLLKEGYTHVVDADIQGYFDNISQHKLIQMVKSRITDRRILSLIESFLQQSVMETAKRWTPEKGTPQGGVISPLLANIYLDSFDHAMREQGFEMTRYADDFVVQCKSREEAENALGIIREWMAKLELTLHPEKTRIASLHEGETFDFLGYKFKYHKGKWKRFPRDKSLKKIKDRVREVTKRANGHSLECIIAKLNPRLRGWFEYYKHSYKTVYEELDGWIRMRLRSILRKRMKRKGRGRGSDHQRWPNVYFREHGLFSLKTAHVKAVQSSRR